MYLVSLFCSFLKMTVRLSFFETVVREKQATDYTGRRPKQAADTIMNVCFASHTLSNSPGPRYAELTEVKLYRL